MKTQKGITLIALIITIIVMLILVGVSVTVALNTGLFKTAQGVAKNTQLEADAEKKLANGTVKIGEAVYESLDAYVKGETPIERPLDILKYRDYVSYEQKFGDGAAKVENWRVISNENGKVTLLGKVENLYITNYPLTKYGTDSLIGDIKITELKEILTAIWPENIFTAGKEGIDDKTGADIYAGMVAAQYRALKMIGIVDGEQILRDIEKKDDNYWTALTTTWIKNGTNKTYDGVRVEKSIDEKIESVYILTEIAAGTIITGGDGAESSPYILGK